MSFVVRFGKIICGGDKSFAFTRRNISEHRRHFFDFCLVNFDLFS